MRNASVNCARKSRSKMNEDILAIFRRYLEMGENRSLSMLARECRSPSIATLKRLSARFGWASLAVTHDEVIASYMLSNFVDTSITSLFTKSDVISIGKRSFYNRVDQQVRGAFSRGKDPTRCLKINVRDYIRLVRLEHELHAEAVRIKSQS